jgi:hypothetical protein
MMNQLCRLFNFIITILLLALSFYCKDLGTQAPMQKFSVSGDSIIVVKDSTYQLIISGGISPYVVSIQPDTLIARMNIISSILTISGVDTGTTFAIISDSNTPISDSIIIQIAVVKSTVPQFVSFSTQIQPIFDNNHCIHCHPGNGGLDLTAGNSYGQLVNATALSSCITLKRVLPGDATNSVLYRKVAGTSCGAQMPEGSTLTALEITNIRDWINQGASNN